MEAKHLLPILVLIFFHYKLASSLDFEGPNYCEYSNNGPCRNKTHLLCNFQRTRGQVDNGFRSAILNPINKFRQDLRNSKQICNLPDLEWRPMLESLAEGAVYRPNFNDYCLANAAYKHILNFTLTRVSSNSNLSSQMNDVIKTGDKPSWMSSAYSNGIGCAINHTRNYVVCMINGVELISSDQSYGYKDECNAMLPKLGNTHCVDTDKEKLNCQTEKHLICNPIQNFTLANFQNMSFTIKKFILHKLMSQGKSVKWNKNLEYLAKQMVTQTLSTNDKCFAISQFPNLTAHLFEGTDRYSEFLSNIDNLWQKNRIRQNVGCAIYTRRTEDSFNAQWNTYLYCLYDFDGSSSSSWIILILIAVIFAICALLSALGILRGKLNNNKDSTVESNPIDSNDKIDVR